MGLTRDELDEMQRVYKQMERLQRQLHDALEECAKARLELRLIKALMEEQRKRQVPLAPDSHVASYICLLPQSV